MNCCFCCRPQQLHLAVIDKADDLDGGADTHRLLKAWFYLDVRHLADIVPLVTLWTSCERQFAPQFGGG